MAPAKQPKDVQVKYLLAQAAHHEPEFRACYLLVSMVQPRAQFDLNVYLDKLCRTAPHVFNAPEVRFADVLFCLHALLLSSVTVGQIAYYDGFAKQAPSRPARYGLAALALYVACTAIVGHEALQILYALSYCMFQRRIDGVILR